VEYHWVEDKYDRVPALMADFVRRRVAVIATPLTAAARAAKSAPPRTMFSGSRRQQLPMERRCSFAATPLNKFFSQNHG